METNRDDIKILTGIPSMGKVHTLWSIMYTGLQWPVSASMKTMVTVKLDIAQARNNMAAQALEGGFKYLFFIDDDVMLPNMAPARMIYLMEQNPEWDALSGIYTTKTTPPEPLIFGGEIGSAGSYSDWRMGEVFPIWGAGLGCCVIRVSCLESMEEPWFRFSESSDGINSSAEGEDLYFFRKLGEAGGTVMADGAIMCGHIDRDRDMIYQMWRESRPYKNAHPAFLADPLSGMVPDEGSRSVVTHPNPGKMGNDADLDRDGK